MIILRKQHCIITLPQSNTNNNLNYTNGMRETLLPGVTVRSTHATRSGCGACRHYSRSRRCYLPVEVQDVGQARSLLVERLSTIAA